MAQKRMLDKKISVSEQVANLGTEGALLFTWMIPHADDFGILPHSPRTVKALVVPMFDGYTTETVGIHLESMRKQGLLEEFEYKKTKYYRLATFSKAQTLKKDRQPNTILDLELDDDPKKSWKLCEEVVESIWNPDGAAAVPEVKRREEKLSKRSEEREGSVREGKTISAEDGGAGFKTLKEKLKTLGIKKT